MRADVELRIQGAGYTQASVNTAFPENRRFQGIDQDTESDYEAWVRAALQSSHSVVGFCCGCWFPSLGGAEIVCGPFLNTCILGGY